MEQRVFSASMSRDEINALPLGAYEGRTELVTSGAELRRALAALKKEDLLGFDTETRASFRKGESYPPALVQLAGASCVYIFRLEALGEQDGLMDLFENGHVLKAGVGLEQDLRKLHEMNPFTPRGFVEIASLADEAGIESNGLRGLAAIVLGIRVSKGAQRSNWGARRLSRRQITYAATDAWVCREIFLRLRAAVGEGAVRRLAHERILRPPRPESERARSKPTGPHHAAH